jgi:hypothetical protein
MSNFILLGLVYFLLGQAAAQAQTKPLSTQHYLGTWTGQSKQQPGAPRTRYQYKLVFDRAESHKLYGRAYVCFEDDTTQRGEILLEATQTDTGLVVQYTQVVLNHVKSGSWCLKYMVLRWREEGDTEVLSGPWTAPRCPPGFSEVVRVKPSLEQQTAVVPAVRVVKEMTVNQKKITLLLWDDQQEDGDILSLRLDGRYLVQELALKKEKTRLVVELSSGEHELVLIAENVGSIPPNTLALIVDDGQQQQRVVLKADAHYSESLKIKVP